MQVKNGLAAVGVRINDDAITVIGESLIACNCGRGQEQMSEQIFISLAGRVGRVDMPSRNDQDVRRRLRRDVVKGKALVVLINL